MSTRPTPRETPKPAIKPPLGIMPEWLWREQRMWNLIHVLDEYAGSNWDYELEWLEELHQRIGEVIANKKGNANESTPRTP